jgi:hypothetical protein
MKLLIKFPTRDRPQKSVETLKKYIELANDLSTIKIIVSIDEDDKTLNKSMFKIHNCVEVISGPSLGKIGAINRDMPDPSTFDIVLLASDDMIPIVKGYDNIIRNKMKQHFPDTDGVLWFNDGYTGFRLNTLVICGSKYYSRFGYLYCPDYKSLFCDNEFMEVATRLGRQIYFDQVIIKHEHPANTRYVRDDALYNSNYKYWNTDKNIYERRKFRDYDVSILICTIPSRKHMFINLWNSIQKLIQSLTLTVEVLYDDSLNMSIGQKRNSLLDKATGKYCAFVDDDDKLTEDYFKVIEASELKYDCVSFNGSLYMNGIYIKPFYHSLKYSKWIDGTHAYYRPPNHLNPMKTEIAKKIRFPSANYHEDRDFSKRLLDSGLVKTEYNHDKIQYLYMYVSKNPENRHVEIAKNDVRNVMKKFLGM